MRLDNLKYLRRMVRMRKTPIKARPKTKKQESKKNTEQTNKQEQTKKRKRSNDEGDNNTPNKRPRNIVDRVRKAVAGFSLDQTARAARRYVGEVAYHILVDETKDMLYALVGIQEPMEKIAKRLDEMEANIRFSHQYSFHTDPRVSPSFLGEFQQAMANREQMNLFCNKQYTPAEVEYIGQFVQGTKHAMNQNIPQLSNVVTEAVTTILESMNAQQQAAHIEQVTGLSHLDPVQQSRITHVLSLTEPMSHWGDAIGALGTVCKNKTIKLVGTSLTGVSLAAKGIGSLAIGSLLNPIAWSNLFTGISALASILEEKDNSLEEAFNALHNALQVISDQIANLHEDMKALFEENKVHIMHNQEEIRLRFGNVQDLLLMNAQKVNDLAQQERETQAIVRANHKEVTGYLERVLHILTSSNYTTFKNVLAKATEFTYHDAQQHTQHFIDIVAASNSCTTSQTTALQFDDFEQLLLVLKHEDVAFSVLNQTVNRICGVEIETNSNVLLPFNPYVWQATVKTLLFLENKQKIRSGSSYIIRQSFLDQLKKMNQAAIVYTNFIQTLVPTEIIAKAVSKYGELFQQLQAEIENERSRKMPDANTFCFARSAALADVDSFGSVPIPVKETDTNGTAYYYIGSYRHNYGNGGDNPNCGPHSQGNHLNGHARIDFIQQVKQKVARIKSSCIVPTVARVPIFNSDYGSKEMSFSCVMTPESPAFPTLHLPHEMRSCVPAVFLQAESILDGSMIKYQYAIENADMVVKSYFTIGSTKMLISCKKIAFPSHSCFSQAENTWKCWEGGYYTNGTTSRVYQFGKTRLPGENSSCGYSPFYYKPNIVPYSSVKKNFHLQAVESISQATVAQHMHTVSNLVQEKLATIREDLLAKMNNFLVTNAATSGIIRKLDILECLLLHHLSKYVAFPKVACTHRKLLSNMRDTSTITFDTSQFQHATFVTLDETMNSLHSAIQIFTPHVVPDEVYAERANATIRDMGLIASEYGRKMTILCVQKALRAAGKFQEAAVLENKYPNIVESQIVSQGQNDSRLHQIFLDRLKLSVHATLVQLKSDLEMQHYFECAQLVLVKGMEECFMWHDMSQCSLLMLRFH